MHKPQPLPSIDRLNEVFELRDGRLFWKHRPLEICSSKKEFLRWNKQYAGTEVGTSQEFGHRRYDLDGKTFYVHRTIWKMVKNVDPTGLIDHRNGKAAENEIGNLRDCDQGQNTLNRKINKNNVLGVRGVYKNGNRFVARMRFKGKHHAFGSHATLDEAKAAYAKGRLKLTGEPSPLMDRI